MVYVSMIKLFRAYKTKAFPIKNYSIQCLLYIYRYKDIYTVYIDI